MRLQLALNVRDLDGAVDFYSRLFGVRPNKRKSGYANFAIAEPPLKLVLFESPDAPDRVNHLGVEVNDDAAVRKATERLVAAGLADAIEENTTCCHARQNKVWATEPEGLRWEWYRVIEDVDGADAGKVEDEAESDAPACCIPSQPVTIGTASRD